MYCVYLGHCRCREYCSSFARSGGPSFCVLRVWLFSTCARDLFVYVCSSLHRMYGEGMGHIVVCGEQCMIRLPCNINEINNNKMDDIKGDLTTWSAFALI